LCKATLADNELHKNCRYFSPICSVLLWMLYQLPRLTSIQNTAKRGRLPSSIICPETAKESPTQCVLEDVPCYSASYYSIVTWPMSTNPKALVASEGYDMVITTSGLVNRNARRIENGLGKMLKAPVEFLSTPSVQHLISLLARKCPHIYTVLLIK